MPDEPNNETTTEPQSDGDGGPKGFTPITTPTELDAFLKGRVARAERKALERYADYDAIKAKADRLDTIEAATKTEAEKAADRIADLERQLADTQASVMRAGVQAKHGISDEDAALFLTATDEDTLTKQAERLSARAAERKKSGNRDPLAGRTPTSGPAADADERAAARSLFGGGDD